jgi:hypothetical protein
VRAKEEDATLDLLLKHSDATLTTYVKTDETLGTCI